MPPPSDADLGGGAGGTASPHLGGVGGTYGEPYGALHTCSPYGEPGGVGGPVLETVTRSTWLGRGFRVKEARARVRVIGLGL